MRRALLAEAPALAAIHGAAFASPWDARSLAGFMGDVGALTLAAGDPPSGFILVRVMAGEAEVLTLAVQPSARRAGLGRALVQAAVLAASAEGAASLFLEVAADNEAALGLYLGAGFVEVGRRRDYYRRPPGAAMDALVLKRDLRCDPARTGA